MSCFLLRVRDLECKKERVLWQLANVTANITYDHVELCCFTRMLKELVEAKTVRTRSSLTVVGIDDTIVVLD
jgi:hypothetical protein